MIDLSGAYIECYECGAPLMVDIISVMNLSSPNVFYLKLYSVPCTCPGHHLAGQFQDYTTTFIPEFPEMSLLDIYCTWEAENYEATLNGPYNATDAFELTDPDMIYDRLKELLPACEAAKLRNRGDL